MAGWDVVFSEKQLVHFGPLYVGTVDLVRFEGATNTFEICDLKTHKPSKDELRAPARYEDFVQTDGYELALRQMGLIPAGANVQHRIVVAQKDGNYGESTVRVDPGDFLKVFQVYRSMKGEH
jgi:hypothetical protein